MTAHTVSVSGFEGPLDLLLELIEQEKMDVTQVSLAHVTNQYVQRIRAMDAIPPEELAQFLVIAARLILLKSRRLIPQLTLTPDEEESILSLEQQLREYQKFRAKARMLREQWQSARHLHAREGFLGITVMFYPPPGMTPSMLHGAVTALVRTLPIIEREREQAIRKIISLEERIRELQSRVQEAAVTSFRDSITKGKRRADVIVSFLALLELVKQSMLSAEQSNAFHDILIRKRSSS